MKTVNELATAANISVRTLHHYDAIGLLKPSLITESGYRLYDDAALERLYLILLFRELEFPLKDIRKIIRSPGFDRSKALDQQIGLLKLKKEHIENLIDLAERIKETEVGTLSFDAFDTGKLEKYAAQAKASWGTTPAYQEYEKKSKNRTEEETRDISRGLMDIFAEFGAIRNTDPASEAAQALVKKLQKYITDNFYDCTKDILRGLGEMYVLDERFRSNIDKLCRH